MYFDDSFPFYMTYPFLMQTPEEREQERDWKTMQSFYSQMASRIQQKVESECDRMEYDGSLMFDEYPDKFMMEHLCRKIEKQLELENQETEPIMVMNRGGDDYLRDLIGVLLFNEMYRRRCKRRKTRRYYTF